MKNIVKWFIDNWGSFFSLIGVIFTIYFGVFYVPASLKEAAKQKELAIQNDILQTAKELIYSDSISKISEIQNLIRGKEIKYDINYKYNLEQLLLQTQESFMEHKFLPLTKRKQLVFEVDELKNTIPKEGLKEPINNNSILNSTSVLTLLSILFSILGSIAAVYSLWFKRKEDMAKSKEIENQVLKERSEAKPASDYASNFEKRIFDIILKKIKPKDYKINPISDNPIDLEFTHNNIKNYVFVKYLTKSKIGLGTIRKFFNELDGKEGNAIVIYNTGFTPMVLKEMDQFQQENKGKILMKLWDVKTIDDFEKKFKL